MQKRWLLKPTPDQSIVQNLAKELNIDAIIASLLVQRGVTSFEEAKSFFRPELSNLHDPFLMKDMDKAISRIESAINKQEKIMVFGDYDVDGTTAVSLVYSFFKNVHSNIEYYIPD